MKHATTRVLSLALTALLFFSFCTPTLAVSNTDAEKNDKISVACIGDSISNGYSLYTLRSSSSSFGLPNKLPYTGDWSLFDQRDQFQFIEGYNDSLPADDPYNLEITQRFEKDLLKAYGAQVAMQLNLTESEIAKIDTFEEFYNAVDYRGLTGNADRSIDVRMVFDDEYRASLYEEGSGFQEIEPGPVPNNRKALEEHLEEYIAGNDTMEPVDVLLYAIGYNDYYYGPGCIAETVPEEEYTQTLVSETLKGLQTYSENLPIILDYFQKLNPDMEIVLLGVYNPSYSNELEVSSETDTDQIFTFASSVINSLLRKEADSRNNVTFVDINGTNCYNVDENGYVTGDGTHPSAVGHAYIARRIMSALPSNLTDSRRYDISVDIQSIYNAGSTVKSVLVNNTPTNDYSLNGYTLTIHYTGISAKNVKVTVDNNGVTSVSSWQATYNITDGYRTYPLYKIGNLTSFTQNLIQKLKELCNSLVNKLTSSVKSGI